LHLDALRKNLQQGHGVDALLRELDPNLQVCDVHFA